MWSKERKTGATSLRRTEERSAGLSVEVVHSPEALPVWTVRRRSGSSDGGSLMTDRGARSKPGLDGLTGAKIVCSPFATGHGII